MRRYTDTLQVLSTRNKKIERIGIALAAYNPNIDFFVEQLDSIRSQTFRNWICFISLDSPLNDLPKERLKEFFQDSRFVWRENKIRLGFKRNFESAIKAVSENNIDAVALSDQDDIWYPEKLEKLADHLDTLPIGSLVHSNMHILEDGQDFDLKISRDQLPTGWNREPRNVQDRLFIQLLLNNVVTGASCLFDVTLARRFGCIPDEIEFHDQWYAIAATLTGKIEGLSEALYAYRQHPDNLVGSKPFSGMLANPGSSGFFKSLSLASQGWHKAARRFYSVKESALGPYINSTQLRFTDSGLRSGLEFLMYSFLFRPDNPVLAREFLRKGVGKILGKSYRHQSLLAKKKRDIQKIGIALACYRPDPEFFYQQLNSIQNQTMTNWFCVIGCDSDLTELRQSDKFSPFVRDSRFIWIQHEVNKGAKNNFEFAVRECGDPRV